MSHKSTMTVAVAVAVTMMMVMMPTSTGRTRPNSSLFLQLFHATRMHCPRISTRSLKARMRQRLQDSLEILLRTLDRPG
jgi:hypothetical protein